MAPVPVLENKSHPSSALYAAIHPLKTFPSPHVNLAANPSALFCDLSLLLYELQSITWLYDGQSALLVAESVLEIEDPN